MKMGDEKTFALSACFALSSVNTPRSLASFCCAEGV